jgi:hypothetical protein
MDGWEARVVITLLLFAVMEQACCLDQAHGVYHKHEVLRNRT